MTIADAQAWADLGMTELLDSHRREAADKGIDFAEIVVSLHEVAARIRAAYGYGYVQALADDALPVAAARHNEAALRVSLP